MLDKFERLSFKLEEGEAAKLNQQTDLRHLLQLAGIVFTYDREKRVLSLNVSASKLERLVFKYARGSRLEVFGGTGFDGHLTYYDILQFRAQQLTVDQMAQKTLLNKRTYSHRLNLMTTELEDYCRHFQMKRGELLQDPETVKWLKQMIF